VTIDVRIVQNCDGCSVERILESTQDKERGGWREVKPDKDLCPTCINKALNKEK